MFLHNVTHGFFSSRPGSQGGLAYGLLFDQVSLGQQDDIPLIQEQGFAVSPGTHTLVSMEYQVVGCVWHINDSVG